MQRYIFLEKAILLGEVDGLRRRFLVELEDETWRWAYGDDLKDIQEKHPDFFKQVMSGHYEDD